MDGLNPKNCNCKFDLLTLFCFALVKDKQRVLCSKGIDMGKSVITSLKNLLELKKIIHVRMPRCIKIKVSYVQILAKIF